MLDYVADELSAPATIGWRRVLEAYASVVVPAPPAGRPVVDDPSEPCEALGWVPRVSRLDGVETEQLSALHGKLIALGLLTFEVSGKSGVHYQVTPLGRRTLVRGVAFEEATADDIACAASED
jgi:hypothetical protein